MNDKRLENILSKCRSFYRLLSLMSRAFASKMLIVLPLIEIWPLSHSYLNFRDRVSLVISSWLARTLLATGSLIVLEANRESAGNCSRR